MSHSSGGLIHLDDSDANAEEVGSDVEEVVTWDYELCGTKMFSTNDNNGEGNRPPPFSLSRDDIKGHLFPLPLLQRQQRELASFPA